MAYSVFSVGQEDLSSLLTAIIRLPEELNSILKSAVHLAANIRIDCH